MFRPIGKINLTKTYPYSINSCFQVITQVENYPNFLSNVEKLKITSYQPDWISYQVLHNYSLIGQKDLVQYQMQIINENEKTVEIQGSNSQYVKNINYNWKLSPSTNKNFTNISLDLQVEFFDSLYYPLWLSCKDFIIDKNIAQYTQQIKKVNSQE